MHSLTNSRLIFLLVLLCSQPLQAIEYSAPNEQGIHAEQLTLISEKIDENTLVYRGCLLFEAEWQCYELDPDSVEACRFEDNKLVCTSPTQSNTLEILDDVINQGANGTE